VIKLTAGSPARPCCRPGTWPVSPSAYGPRSAEGGPQPVAIPGI